VSGNERESVDRARGCVDCRVGVLTARVELSTILDYATWCAEK
jgi:hypothetical protein